MGKGSLQSFFKGFDRFSKPISLTYNQAGSFNTAIGGVFSIFTFFVFISWFALEIIEVYMPPGKFSTSTLQQMAQNTDGTWPVYNMTRANFLTTFEFDSDNEEVLREVHQYVAGLWVQMENGVPSNYWSAVNCTDRHEQMNFSPQYWSQLQGQHCPNMTDDETVHLRNKNPFEKDVKGASFYFVVDSCENLASQTGQTDCKTQAETEAVIDQIYVKTKIKTEFWNPKNFVRNDFIMNSQFDSGIVQLQKGVFQRQAYFIQKNSISFKNSKVWNSPMSYDSEQLAAFEAMPGMSTIHQSFKPNVTSTSEKPNDSPFSMHFQQANTIKTTSSVREAISNTFQRFGSYLALMLRFIGYVLGSFQKHSIDNSMIKKLYSQGNEDDDDDNADGDNRNPRAVRRDTDAYNQKLSEEIDSRKTFSHSFQRFTRMRWFQSYWCCCCRNKDKRVDFLFAEAKKKLYKEIDLLEIIKQLRVYQFTSQVTLTQEQIDMILYFQDYKLGDETKKKLREEMERDPARRNRGGSIMANVPEAMKPDVQANRIERAKTMLDPKRDRVDALIYERIMNEEVENCEDSKSNIERSAARSQQNLNIDAIIQGQSQGGRSQFSPNGGFGDRGEPRPSAHFYRELANERSNRRSSNLGDERQERLLRQDGGDDAEMRNYRSNQ